MTAGLERGGGTAAGGDQAADKDNSEPGRDGPGPPVPAAGVLADRMAAALVHREPGWKLPRRSALARRYNVSLTEIDAALDDLARRSLVRRLPDGQLRVLQSTGFLMAYDDPVGLARELAAFCG